MYAACAAEGLLEEAGTGLVRLDVWLRTTIESSDLCGYEWTIGPIAGQLHHLDAGEFLPIVVVPSRENDFAIWDSTKTPDEITC